MLKDKWQNTFVVIKQGGMTYSGELLENPINWGTEEDPDWYVCFQHDPESDGRDGDPGYCKQKLDNVSSVEFIKVDEQSILNLVYDFLEEDTSRLRARLNLEDTGAPVLYLHQAGTDRCFKISVKEIK